MWLASGKNGFPISLTESLSQFYDLCTLTVFTAIGKMRHILLSSLVENKFSVKNFN